MENKTFYGLHGKLTTQAGTEKALANILLEAAALMKSAPGCRLYAVSLDPLHPREVWITEIWDSKEDHDQSLTLPGVRELIGQAMPMLEGSPQKGQVLTVLGGLGVG